MDLGRALRDARTAAELSQEELAQRSGVRHATISRIERGSTVRPRPGTLEALEEVLHVKLPRPPPVERRPELEERVGALEVVVSGITAALVEHLGVERRALPGFDEERSGAGEMPASNGAARVPRRARGHRTNKGRPGPR
jgi:transcriptional regulator with XRE-family HTH domain